MTALRVLAVPSGLNYQKHKSLQASLDLFIFRQQFASFYQDLLLITAYMCK